MDLDEVYTGADVTRAESDFDDSDIRLPTITASNTNHEQTRVLLLSTSGLEDDKLEGTLQRVRRLSSVTGGYRIAIVFLMHPPCNTRFTSARQELDRTEQGQAGAYNSRGTFAYARLQALLFDEVDLFQVPISPLATLGDLPTLLSGMCQRTSKSHHGGGINGADPNVTTFELLQKCTANPPMAQETAFFLSDIFPDLVDLARTCSMADDAVTEGLDSSPTVLGEETDGAAGHLAKLQDLVGEAQTTSIVGFWKEEWIAD